MQVCCSLYGMSYQYKHMQLHMLHTSLDSHHKKTLHPSHYKNLRMQRNRECPGPTDACKSLNSSQNLITDLSTSCLF